MKYLLKWIIMILIFLYHVPIILLSLLFCLFHWSLNPFMEYTLNIIEKALPAIVEGRHIDD